MSKIKKVIPLDFGLKLATNKEALTNYSNLEKDIQDKIIDYLNDSILDEENASKTNSVINSLEKNSISFLKL